MLRTATLLAFAVTVVGFVGVSAAAGGPNADAGLDQTVTVDTTVQLDATGSTHPGGTIEAYEWTIQTPDGRTITPECIDCERTQFRPTTPGRYEVTLSVTSAVGTEAEDTLYVYVDDAGPSVQLSGQNAPAPGELVEFEATAQSPDAELAEIAWAVDDEIVATRSLSGDADRSSFEIAFVEPVTHRVQVVVRDSNGRTAYDHVFVQPQGEESRTTDDTPAPDPDDAEGRGCQDADYFSKNPGECLNVTVDEPTPESDREQGDSEIGTVQQEEIYYKTDGYGASQFAGADARDSSFINFEVDSVGLDGGENAPWKKGPFEQVYEPTASEVSTSLFGQKRKTVSCEIEGGEMSACARRARELEEKGGTTNYYSPDEGGAYSKYGLHGAERIEGSDPMKLEDGQTAEVVVVIQPEKEGAVDRASQSVAYAADSSAAALEDAADRIKNVHEGASNRVTENLLAGRSETNDPQDAGEDNSDGPLSTGSEPVAVDDPGGSSPTGLAGSGRKSVALPDPEGPPSSGGRGTNVGVI